MIEDTRVVSIWSLRSDENLRYFGWKWRRNSSNDRFNCTEGGSIVFGTLPQTMQPSENRGTLELAPVWIYVGHKFTGLPADRFSDLGPPFRQPLFNPTFFSRSTMTFRTFRPPVAFHPNFPILSHSRSSPFSLPTRLDESSKNVEHRSLGSLVVSMISKKPRLSLTFSISFYFYLFFFFLSRFPLTLRSEAMMLVRSRKKANARIIVGLIRFASSLWSTKH